MTGVTIGASHNFKCTVLNTFFCLPVQEMWVQSLGQEDPLEKKMATHSSILPGKSHGPRSLVGYTVHKIAKSWTRLSD